MDDAAQTQQQTPVSTPQKEQEPIGGAGYIEKVERQPEIPPEVAKVGVKPVSQVVLTDEDKKAGISEAKEEIPISTQPEGLVTLPLTEAEAKKTLKLHKKIEEAIVWLANFVLRQFKILKMRRSKSNA